ncbi:MAG: DUF11 domain-containing protein, partial [Caldilineaceae bacterium]|nr:DUF11 domain-containing protein [Caldilineaceae bacterium]
MTITGLPDPLLSDGDPSSPATAESTDVTVAFAQIVFTKTFTDFNGGTVQPDDVIAFSLNIENLGTFAANNIVVRDPIDSNLELVAMGTGVLEAGTLRWNLTSPLAPGASETLRFEARIAADVAGGTEIRNQANLEGIGVPALVSDWPETSLANDPVLLVVDAMPVFNTSTKLVEHDNERVAPGDLLTYRLQVRNTGTGQARSVRVEDTVSSLLLVESVSSGGIQDGQRLVWELGDVPANAADFIELAFTARVRGDTPHNALLANQALIFSEDLAEPVPTDDPTTPELGDSTDVLIEAQADLSRTVLSVTDVNGGVVLPGDVLRYEVRIVNNGTIAAQNSRLQLVIPAYTQYVAASTLHNGIVVPDIGSDAPTGLGLSITSPGQSEVGLVLVDDGVPPDNEAVLVVLDVRVDPRALRGTRISAQGTVSARGMGAAATDNPNTPSVAGDATVVVVGGGGTMAVAKVAELSRDANDDGRVSPGDSLRYRILIDGDAISNGAYVVRDVLPNGAQYVPGTLRLDGQSLSDADDADAGFFDGTQVVANVAHEDALSHQIDFEIKIKLGVPLLSNQASVESSTGLWLSDGDPRVSGVQPTVTVVEAGAQVLGVDLEVADLNGGVLAADDTL